MQIDYLARRAQRSKGGEILVGITLGLQRLYGRGDAEGSGEMEPIIGRIESKLGDAIRFFIF